MGKMPKQPQITVTPKVTKKYQPTKSEVAKTVVIAMLITGIIAFVGGMTFANNQNAKVNQAVETVKAETATVKK